MEMEDFQYYLVNKLAYTISSTGHLNHSLYVYIYAISCGCLHIDDIKLTFCNWFSIFCKILTHLPGHTINQSIVANKRPLTEKTEISFSYTPICSDKKAVPTQISLGWKKKDLQLRGEKKQQH